MSVYCFFAAVVILAILNNGSTAATAPYRSPYQCPSPKVLTKNCSSCSGNDLCCDSVCTKGVLPPQPCNVVSQSSPSQIGAYVPQCSSDGKFAPIQIWGSTGYSWCVDTSDGKPLTAAVERGKQPNCTVCTVRGNKYYPGQSFPASDSCNTCSCSTNGIASCTTNTCHVNIVIPYRSPYQCPSPQVLTKNCSSCPGDDLCCDSVCTKGVLPPQPCNVVVANSYPSPLGAYVPRCLSDGNFAPIQIWGSTGYSWCVDTSDGKPLSAAVERGKQPNCTVCTENGKKYYPGQSFPSSDGCNTCSCSTKGITSCTTKACAPAPYIAPYQCPSPKVLTKNCSCTGDDLCCDSECTKGVLPPQPCSVVVANSSPSLIGAYVPQCSSDGNFAPIQCRGSTGYCWCVDTSDGKPLSTPVGPGRQPDCAVCTEDGNKYYPGQSFPASDGCNTCFCSTKGKTACTKKACVAPTPYISPYQCPSPKVLTKNCSSCSGDDLCCDSVCTKGVLPPRPCNVASQSSHSLIGAYVPQCSSDGKFAPIQIWGSTGYSWCVDTSDGKPLSAAVQRGKQPNCTVCTVSGNKYYPGQSFPSSDGCNTCSCSTNGVTVCTKEDCKCSVSGQVFTECGSPCEATCQTPVTFCALSCVAKCQCPGGQVVDTKNNKCVKQEECPKPVQSQYISPYQCPSPKVLTKNCSSCSGDDLCCDSVCTKGVLPLKPCNVVVANSYPSPLGAYVPQCSSDGNFVPIQCRGSTGYCWCVDISDGKPLSAAVPPGQQPNCTVCTVSGKKYYPGQTFMASDGCNTCSCTQSGAALCTQRACVACPAKGQLYTSCGSSCEATCDNPAPICAARCVAKCQCPGGTVLDVKSNKCVSPKLCPKPLRGA